MNMLRQVRSDDASPRAVALLLVGLAGLALCLTLLFLGMRAVMDIGGACADGGPYVIYRSCPEGVPIAMIGGIFGLFAFGALTAIGGALIGGRYNSLVLFAWPALFLSLGWNFLEYGMAPPGGGGPEFGWLLPGVVFVVMGGVPLLAALPGRSPLRRDPAAIRRLLADLQARQRQMAFRERASPPLSPAAARRERMDLTSRLERLADLHREGALTDAEFDEAKRRVIAEVAAGR